jgi:mono/diheme cytochrome c family protein
MRKILLITGILFGLIICSVILFVGFIQLKGIPEYKAGNIEFEHVSTPESIERGYKLTSMLCAGCHKNYETGNLTGGLMLDAPPEFGKIYAPNITQDKEYGIGNWTDAELVYLLRTGIKKDGSYAPPYMAKLPKMADEDINAIISFLRSNHPMVAAANIPDQPCEPSFLTKLLCNIVFKPLPYPEEKIAMPDTTNKVALGKYLAFNLECFSCHSADFKTNDFLNPEKSAGYFGGGNKPFNREGKIMLTSNLTPDKETGIGNWSEEKFINALKYGMKEGEHALRYPMQPYSLLTDYEASAIFEYLLSIPAIQNKVERSDFEM